MIYTILFLIKSRTIRTRVVLGLSSGFILGVILGAKVRKIFGICKFLRDGNEEKLIFYVGIRSRGKGKSDFVGIRSRRKGKRFLADLGANMRQKGKM